MKRWLLCAAGILAAAAWFGLPFDDVDVGQLRPLELIAVSVEQGQIRISTDTGDLGQGNSVAEAYADLKQTSPGEIFLDTADYLVLTKDAQALWAEVASYLRPACEICLSNGVVDPEAAAQYLEAHKPGQTIRDYQAGGGPLPLLDTTEGRLRLVRP